MSALPGLLTIGGLGALFAGLSGTRLLRARRLRGAGQTAEAVVVAHRGMWSQGGGRLQSPVLMFTTRDGRTVQVSSPVGRDDSIPLPGQTVTVHYDPADPTTVSIPEHEIGAYRILFAAGLFMLALVAGYGILGDRMLEAVIGIPLFMGAVFFGIGFFGIRRTWRIKHGGRADGVVIGAITTETRNGLPQHHAVIRYVGPNGAVLEVPSASGSVFRPPAPGTHVHVRYDRANPQRMTLAHQSGPAVFWIFGIIGIPLMLIGVAVIVATAT